MHTRRHRSDIEILPFSFFNANEQNSPNFEGDVMRRNWYEVKASAGDAPAVMSIYDEIGMWGVTAKDFISSLSGITSKSVTLEINSPGGSVFDALAIYNALKQSGKDITVKVMGIAASAASFIAMAGKTIVMPENAFMMVHNPMNGVMGNAADMREMADALDKIGNSLVSIYVARTGQSDEQIRSLLAKDSYLSAQECKDLGFADELVPSMAVTAKFERDHLPQNIQALFTASSGGDDPENPDSDAPSDVTADAEAVPAETFAEVVAKIAAEANLTEYVPMWAVDSTIDSVDKIKARVSLAREIVALCTVVNRQGDAKRFISKGNTLAETRAALHEMLAEADAEVTVGVMQKHDGKPSAIKTADIWAECHSKSRGMK